MKNKGKTWLAVLGFVLFAGVAPLLTFPSIEAKLDSQAAQIVEESALEGAELEWNGRNGYLSVPGNTEPKAAQPVVENIESIQGVRNVKVIYDYSRLITNNNPEVETEKMPGKFTMNWTQDEKNISGKLDDENIEMIKDVFDVTGLELDSEYTLSQKVVTVLKSLGTDLFDDLSEGTLDVDGDSIKVSGITAEGVDLDDLKNKWGSLESIELDIKLPENDKTEEEEIEEVQTEIDKLLALENIEFEYKSTDLTEKSQTIVEKIAEILLNNEEMIIEIQGHTDSIGSDKYNIKLSEQRAQSVMDALVKLGVDESRMTAVGIGEAEPIASNETDEGRQQNRRVEIIVKGNY